MNSDRTKGVKTKEFFDIDDYKQVAKSNPASDVEWFANPQLYFSQFMQKKSKQRVIEAYEEVIEKLEVAIEREHCFDQLLQTYN